MEVSVQEMTNEILNCIKQYTEETSEKIAKVCKEESSILKENLKKDSPKGKRMGNKKYSRGWKIKKTSRSGYVQYEIYNTQGHLTHLLEKDIKILSAQQRANKNRCIPKAEERLLILISSQMRKKQRKT